LAAIVASSGDAIIGVSLEGVITSWNQGAAATFGYSAAEVIGRSVRLIMAEDDWARGDRLFEKARDGGQLEPIEAEHVRKDGQRIFVAINTSLTYGLSGEIIGVSSIARDVTEQKRIAAQLIHSATFDSLTGLRNRGSFTEKVREAVVGRRPGDGEVAVLLLDLDHFKDVNDTLGHGAGDHLLRTVSERITTVLADSTVAARFGGDEFAILLDRVESRSKVDQVAQDLLDTISEPFSLDGAEMRIGASIGAAIAEHGLTDAETLLSRADIALYRAKDAGRGAFLHFTEAMDLAVRRRVVLGRELRAGIEAGQLVLFYQPQVQAETGLIIGAEALVRWSHPERGIVGPAEFIPISEGIGLAGAIGRWVINEACRQIRLWKDMGLSPPTVAVNLSATQFTVAGELERDLDDAMERHRISADCLELELTETVLMESSQDHGDTLLRLRERGFALSIDDFGTGYSSLDYLRRFPADRIKIDQNFVKDIEAAPGNEAIVKAIIGLAGQLGMEVIAEGVETKAHRDLLSQWDCRDMQGYYFSRPVTAARMTEFLQNNQRLPL
jgi:diguanylate cyclase (GGDEF)-like protein/PAS domain S-box-containing protein